MTDASLRKMLDQLFTRAINDASGSTGFSAHVMPAGRPEFGDYQVNGVMAAARQLKTNPRELAAKVLACLPTQAEISNLEIAGPGFINIQLADDYLSRQAQALTGSIDGLIPRTDSAQTIVVDYSSPNLAKEMHVGHLRGSIIGDSLVRILARLGHAVIRQNHVGDWGTQFGMLIAHLEDLGTDEAALPRQLADLEGFYRAAKARFDQEPAFAERARACVVKLQSGDASYLAMWRRFIDESLGHCQAIYSRLQLRLQPDDLCPESFYNNRLAGIVDLLDERGLLSVSEGARVVFLPEFKGKDGDALPVIVQKSDGGYLYSTTDLAAVAYRCQELRADRVLYVVDARQSLHFQQIFAVARVAGLSSSHCVLEHVAYGTMMGKDGKPFKTRSGDTVRLAELLDEGQRRAFELVTAKNPALSETQRQEIARVVSTGAIKYSDLSKNRNSDYIFDWDAMLSFEGNTAPYLLYAYTRIQSIFKKQDVIDYSSSKISTETAQERALLIKILQLPEVLEQIAEDYLPSHLSSYLYELAGVFMRFYEACPILKAEAPYRDSRLALAALTARTLREGLELLGLETLEQM